MTWWAWLVVLTALAFGGGLAIWRRVRVLLGSVRALGGQLRAAEAAFAVLGDPPGERSDLGATCESAVFTRPGDAVRERRRVRAALRRQRRQRRERRLPPWARR